MAQSPETRTSQDAAEWELFETAWYINKYCPGRDADAAWSHYCRHGREKGDRPNPLFDPAWYSRTYGDCTPAEAPAHFLAKGAAQNLWPSPLFESDWYARANPDVAAAGVNLLRHYLTFGRHETRVPTPWCGTTATANSYQDLALPDDFATGDLVAYFPHYLRADAPLAGPDSLAFFAPTGIRWLFAGLSSAITAPGLVAEAIVIGGRRELLIDGAITPVDHEDSQADTHRALAVRHAVSPILENAVHLLGRAFAGKDSRDEASWRRLRDYVDAGGSGPRRTLLIDADVPQKGRTALAQKLDAPIDIVPIAAGALFRARNLYYPG